MAPDGSGQRRLTHDPSDDASPVLVAGRQADRFPLQSLRQHGYLPHGGRRQPPAPPDHQSHGRRPARVVARRRRSPSPPEPAATTSTSGAGRHRPEAPDERRGRRRQAGLVSRRQADPVPQRPRRRQRHLRDGAPTGAAARADDQPHPGHLPAWSPTASRSSSPATGSPYNPDLFVMNADGSGRHRRPRCPDVGRDEPGLAAGRRAASALSRGRRR